MMKLCVYALAVTICILQLNPVKAENEGQPAVIKKVNCTPFCHRVGCIQRVTPCAVNEALIPGDGDCYCCNACVPIKYENSESCEGDCAAVRCDTTITPEYCVNQNMAFLIKDDKCRCCNTCYKPETILTN